MIVYIYIHMNMYSILSWPGWVCARKMIVKIACGDISGSNPCL